MAKSAKKPKPAKSKSKPKLKAVKEDAAPHEDGYVNSLTGVGDYLQDKTYAGRQTSVFALTQLYGIECEARWRGSDLGARIVECIPDEMVREGWEITIQPDEDGQGEEGSDNETSPKGESSPEPTLPADEVIGKKDAFPPNGAAAPMMPPEPQVPKPIEEKDNNQETIEELTHQMEDLGLVDAVWMALSYERAFGGSVILLGDEDSKSLDGQDLTKPLNEDRINQITHLNVFSAGRDCECTAWSWYTDMNAPKYGQPEVYLIRRVGIPTVSFPYQATNQTKPALPQFLVHESRVIAFRGNRTSRRANYENLGFGDSIFTRIDEILSQYGQAWGGLSVLMTEFSQAWLKVPGLKAALSSRDKAANAKPLTARMQAIQRTRSMVRMLVMDGEEEFGRDNATLAGVSDVLEQFALRLAAAADMPVTLLMGQSPAGMNATGESDIQMFYDRVAAKQERRLKPQLTRLIRLLFLAKEGPTKGVEPDRWSVKMNALYQDTEKEDAEIRYLAAQTDQIYINTQVLSPEEVAASAFGGSKYSRERVIDYDGRQQAADDQAKKEEDKQAIMSEAAKKGVDPGQLAMNHPENPLNLPQSKAEQQAAKAKNP